MQHPPHTGRAPLIAVAALAAAGWGAPGHGAGANEYLESIRDDPVLMAQFFERFPKGGDIHHHLIGAPFPETLVELAAAAGLCVDNRDLTLAEPPCDPATSRPAAGLDAVGVTRLIDLWSMRGHRGQTSANDHFFAIFPRIGPAVRDGGAILSVLRRRAADERLVYLETIAQAPAATARVRELAGALTWTGDLSAAAQTLRDDPRFADIVREAAEELARYTARSEELLGCTGSTADDLAPSGCGVAVRYQYYVLRILPPALVLADTLLACATAAASSQVVGVNIVGYEGDPVALRDYRLHMRMLALPDCDGVNRSLHAGELSLDQALPENLNHAIADALDIAGARRIGHGLAITREDDAVALMRRMAAGGIAVEVPLTSNELLVGMAGADHPMPALHRAGVPLVLATDDAGIFRTDLSREFRLAAQRYPVLRYDDFKAFARNSLQFSFLEGASLWAGGYSEPVACKGALTGAEPDARCQDLLADSARARLQFRLERQLRAFESGLADAPR